MSFQPGQASISSRSGSRAYREEEVADIMCDVNSQAHVSEVEAIAQPYQRDGDNVMCNQLVEVFPGLL